MFTNGKIAQHVLFDLGTNLQSNHVVRSNTAGKGIQYVYGRMIEGVRCELFVWTHSHYESGRIFSCVDLLLFSFARSTVFLSRSTTANIVTVYSELEDTKNALHMLDEASIQSRRE